MRQKNLTEFGFLRNGFVLSSEKVLEMGELKSAFMPKDKCTSGVIVHCIAYEEKKGQYGDDLLLTVQIDKPFSQSGDDEFTLSLWTSNVRKYVREILKRKQFDAKDFVGKTFKISSAKLKTVELEEEGKKTSKDVYGWLQLEYIKETVELEKVE